jgi:hypothetical protein
VWREGGREDGAGPRTPLAAREWKVEGSSGAEKLIALHSGWTEDMAEWSASEDR